MQLPSNQGSFIARRQVMPSSNLLTFRERSFSTTQGWLAFARRDHPETAGPRSSGARSSPQAVLSTGDAVCGDGLVIDARLQSPMPALSETLKATVGTSPRGITDSIAGRRFGPTNHYSHCV